MVIIAMTLYLPQHITLLTSRAWFYYNGDESAKAAVQSFLESPTSTGLAEKVKETVVAGGAGTGSTILGAGKEL
ncbi:hypothetical protein BUE80_DR005272 [Diplocarpon rosae]|nr:hypothetical protein BUE80_DR005272 [Diplocarpon rosae]